MQNILFWLVMSVMCFALAWFWPAGPASHATDMQILDRLMIAFSAVAGSAIICVGTMVLFWWLGV